ncbi:MAG: hypothetical protein ABF581_04450 [Bifidobacterium sp.]
MLTEVLEFACPVKDSHASGRCECLAYDLRGVVEMLGLVLVLLVLWIIGGIAGLLLKGVLWLFWVSLVLFVITAVFGFVRGLFSGKRS